MNDAGNVCIVIHFPGWNSKSIKKDAIRENLSIIHMNSSALVYLIECPQIIHSPKLATAVDAGTGELNCFITQTSIDRYRGNYQCGICIYIEDCT